MTPRFGGDDDLIEGAIRDLEAAFAAAGELWRDQSREEFAQNQLEPMLQRAREAVRTIREIEAILRDAVRQSS